MEEFDFFRKNKTWKLERKRLSAKDRSKYKITDQRKLQKERSFSSNSNSLSKGRVISVTSEGISVEEEKSIIICSLRGSLKKEKTRQKNLIVVGDSVLFEKVSQKEGLILHIEPRKTLFSRADNLSRKKEQLLAANIDQVIGY